jgi:hypothetical protein
LLGASLSLAVAGCTDAGKPRKDKDQPTVNPKEPPEEDHVNVGPEEPAPKPEPEPIHVNEGPQPTTAAEPPTPPEPPTPEPEPIAAPEEKRVNTRPSLP